MTEIWKDIAGHEGHYQVSNLGNVRSLTRAITLKDRNCTYKGRKLKQGNHSAGYRVVNLCLNLKVKQYYVHRLVASAFLIEDLTKPFVNHIDSNPSNNHISNLEYVTHAGNLQHALLAGIKVGRTKLTKNDRLEIKELRNKGVKVADIAIKFNVLQAAIYELLKGDTWSWEK